MPAAGSPAGAGRTPSAGILIYTVVATYVAYYGLLLAWSMVRHPAFALVPVWLLVLGAWVASNRRSRLRWIPLIVLSLLAAATSFTALHLGQLLPVRWGWLALGGGLFALAANPWSLRPKILRPGVALAISAGFFAVIYALALRRAAMSDLLGVAFVTFNLLLEIANLFWFWMGLELFRGARDLAAWLAEHVASFVQRKRMLLAVVVLWRTGKLPCERLMALFGLSLTAFLVLYAGYGIFYSLSELSQPIGSQFWTLPATVWRFGRWEGVLDGLFYTCALGLGLL
jgi:hypothetical protein